jgi:DNA-directed RNA polymerase subunit beta'
MAKEKLSLNVESLKLSEEALKQLKLSGIDKLEDFNTFSLKELRMLLANSFEEITSILRRYSLPRVLENLNITNEVITLLKQNSINDTVDLLEFDRHALYHIFEEDKILIQEVNDVLKFYGFDALHEHAHDGDTESEIDVVDFISCAYSRERYKRTSCIRF